MDGGSEPLLVSFADYRAMWIRKRNAVRVGESSPVPQILRPNVGGWRLQ